MAKERKKRSIGTEGGEVEMTPMIDVVFQLLVYFVVTIKPVDIPAHLDVFRPAAGAPPDDNSTPPKMIQIQINPGTLLINGRAVTVEKLGEILTRLGELSATQTVMITCHRESKHEKLVQVLDRCTEAGLTNLSVASMN